MIRARMCHIVDIAESHGGSTDCRDAVLSVPLSFSETQRAATRLMSLYTEPLAYCWLRKFWHQLHYDQLKIPVPTYRLAHKNWPV